MKIVRHSSVPLDVFEIQWNVPVLNENEVHIWFSELDADEHKLHFLRNLLSQDELERSQFFSEKKVQNNYVIAHGILRQLLSIYSGISADKIEFRVSDSGKPYLKNDTFFFNLTHSGNRFGIAISKTAEVGLDLEMVRSLYDFDQMIAVNFRPSEQAYIDKNSKGFENRFFEMWTIKESYLKLTGEGMRRNPDSLEFFVDENAAKLISIDHSINKIPVNVMLVDAGPGYKAALAVRGHSSVVLSNSIS